MEILETRQSLLRREQSLDVRKEYSEAGTDQGTEEKLAEFYKKYGFLNAFLLKYKLTGTRV